MFLFDLVLFCRYSGPLITLSGACTDIQHTVVVNLHSKVSDSTREPFSTPAHLRSQGIIWEPLSLP